MNSKVSCAILLALGVCISLSFVSAEDCWWSGCQPNTWAQRGCFPADQWSQKKSEPCHGGDKYYCCRRGGSSGGSSGRSSGGSNPPPKTRNGRGLVSYDQFSNAVVSNGYPQPSKTVYNAYIQGLPKGSISGKVEAAMALAQLLHESDGLKAKREYKCAANKCAGEYATPGCDKPGQHYYGRGYIQLTWCSNYRAASQALLGNDDLVRNPDQVASNENLAWDTAFWYWKTNVHSSPGVSKGKFGATTKAINGALECRGDSTTARKRFRMYVKVRAAFGLSGSGSEKGCYN